MRYYLAFRVIASFFIVAWIGVSLVTGVSFAVVRDPAMNGVREYDPLQHAHLILRGKVTVVTRETRPGSDWGFGSGGIPLTAARVEISVVQVLKGEWKEPTAVGYAFWSEREFDPTQEYIFCAKWQDTRTGRVAWVGELPGLYERDGDKWVLCERFPVPGDEVESLTTAQVEARVRQASLASMVDSSDVVAQGVVDSVWTSRYKTRGDRFGVLEHFKLRVTALFKGQAPSNRIEFVVPKVGASYVPKWYRAVPPGMNRGTEWLVFLKEGVRGLYAFGGPNSVLQVKGSSLIYDGRVHYRLSVEEATRAVQSEVSRANE
jgi:hypothetical protein